MNMAKCKPIQKNISVKNRLDTKQMNYKIKKQETMLFSASHQTFPRIDLLDL